MTSTTSASPDASAKSPNTLAAEALAAASRQVLESRRAAAAGNGNGDGETEANTSAEFPNGGADENMDDGSMTGKLTTISGTKRGRDDIHEEHSVQEVGGGRGGSAALAVASGSADDANAGHHRNGGPFEIWNGGSASTAATGAGRGDGIDPLLNLASPNTLEGGRGGDENGVGTLEKVAGGTAMFAATIKRRRRGGEKTTTNSSSNSDNAGFGIESIGDLLRARGEDAEEADDDHASRTAADNGGNGNDAEEQLDAIWKAVHSKSNHQFGPGIAEGDEEDASTTLLASPSTVNTTHTFDTDNTDGSSNGTSSHTLLANLTSAALSKTESLLLSEMEALIASGVQAHHDRDSALRELELMKELAEGRGREVHRLQESERQSRETISNLLRNVESAKSDARAASRRIQAETRLRSECTTLRTERDAAYADAAESKRRATLAEEETRTARAQLSRCQRDKAQMERDSRAALSLARTLDSHTSSDSAYYKRQMAALNEQVQKLHATVTEQNHTINELRRQRERSMSQNQLSQLRAGACSGGAGGGSKKSRHRK